jgi:hypothetical protein
MAETLWRKFAKSQFSRVEYAAIVTLNVRGCAAIAAAAANNDRQPYIGVAMKCARTLARKHARWASAVSLLIEACVANVKSERQRTLDLLQRAEVEFRACEMLDYVSACQYRRGTLVGDKEGRELIAAAGKWATSQRVVNPARVFDMLAPGRWEPA